MRQWNICVLSILATHFLPHVLSRQRFEVRRSFFSGRNTNLDGIVRRGGSIDELSPSPWGVNPLNSTGVPTAENQLKPLAKIVSNYTPTTISTSREKIPQWKSSLPEALRNKSSQTLQKLCMFGCIDIYLIGTAHVSNDSSADVQQLLSHVEPECIFLELCDARMSLLGSKKELINNSTTESATSLESKPVQRITWKDRFSKRTNRNVAGNGCKNENHLPGTSTGDWFQTMSTVLLTSVQEDYAAQLGVELGGEFRCAHQYWFDRQLRRPQLNDYESQAPSNDWNFQKQRSSPPHLILGDRPVQITLIRAWESLSWWARIKVCAGLVWSALPFGKPSTEELRAWLASVMQNDESDILSQSLEELRQSFPTLHTTIIAERDAWLAAKLIQTSHALHLQNEQQALIHSEKSRKRRRSIVALVGAGHVPGIVQWLTAPPTEKTAEEVLAELVTTKRWANDTIVQQELIPSWIYDVVEVNSDMAILQ